MIIRIATAEDAQGIYDISAEAFHSPWSLEAITDDLNATERTIYIVIEEDGQLIAYAGAWLVLDEGQITNIAVKPAFRKDGYGIMVTRKLIKEIWKLDKREIFLEVRVSNVAALALYRRLGFATRGMRKDFYDDPKEDALIMSLIRSDEEIKESI